MVGSIVRTYKRTTDTQPPRKLRRFAERDSSESESQSSSLAEFIDDGEEGEEQTVKVVSSSKSSRRRSPNAEHGTKTSRRRSNNLQVTSSHEELADELFGEPRRKSNNSASKSKINASRTDHAESKTPSTLLKYVFKDPAEEPILGKRQPTLEGTIAYLKERLPHLRRLDDAQFVFRANVRLEGVDEEIRIFPDVWKECVLENSQTGKILLEIKPKPPSFIRKHVNSKAEVLDGPSSESLDSIFEIHIRPPFSSHSQYSLQLQFPRSKSIRAIYELLGEIYCLQVGQYSLVWDGARVNLDLSWSDLKLLQKSPPCFDLIPVQRAGPQTGPEVQETPIKVEVLE